MPDLFPVHTGDAVSIGATEAEPKTIVNSGKVDCYYGPGSALQGTRLLNPSDPEAKRLKPGERATVTAPTYFTVSNALEATSIAAIEEPVDDDDA